MDIVVDKKGADGGTCVLVIGIMLVICPFLLGAGIKSVLNRVYKAEKFTGYALFLYGLICTLGIFEIGHLAGVILDFSLLFSGKIVLGCMAIAEMIALLLVCIRRNENREKKRSNRVSPIMLLFGAMFVFQIVYLWTSPVLQTSGDITLETVNSFLATNGIYSVSPLTGKSYSGAPFRYEILCLPTIYAWISSWLKMNPELVVVRIVPSIILCAAYMAYYLLADTLFEGYEDKKSRQWLFMLFVSVIFILCEGAVFSEGYGVLHGGHLGTTMRNSILIPLVLHGALERKWVLAILCVLAEACIVWTFWGLGLCIVVLAGVILARLILKSKLFRDKEGVS